MFNSQRGLLVLVLSLMVWGLSARAAHTQTFTPTQVQQYLKIRLMQANALNGLIQQLALSPAAQLPNSSVQATIALYQTALANVQYQINQLQLLAAALNQAFAVDAQMQQAQNAAVQIALANALATIQYQISTLQTTIVVP